MQRMHSGAADVKGLQDRGPDREQGRQEGQGHQEEVSAANNNNRRPAMAAAA